jgi:hypothetical protein
MESESGRLTYAVDDLLADDDAKLAPLVAGGVRCHGGFDVDGRYRSPRTLHRLPAIHAWQSKLRDAGHEVIAIDPSLVPPHHPTVDQAKLLLSRGVREPIVRVLTMISILEGFGAVIRDLPVPDLRSMIVEPIDGTAIAHLDRGLFEAHARDEAGHRDRGGHKQMWEAARDLALEKPKVPGDLLMRMMSGGGPSGRTRARERAFPQIDPALERMTAMMTSVLVIEVFAADTFDWGERLLSDPEVSADPKGAGAMVGYIRADESPHVEYLRTALSEIRARTLRTVDGKTMAGKRLTDFLLDRALRFVIENRPKEQREAMRAHVPQTLLADYDDLERAWTPPDETGFECS